jgi:hypothetical protein
MKKLGLVTIALTIALFTSTANAAFYDNIWDDSTNLKIAVGWNYWTTHWDNYYADGSPKNNENEGLMFGIDNIPISLFKFKFRLNITYLSFVTTKEKDGEFFGLTWRTKKWRFMENFWTKKPYFRINIHAGLVKGYSHKEEWPSVGEYKPILFPTLEAGVDVTEKFTVATEGMAGPSFAAATIKVIYHFDFFKK